MKYSFSLLVGILFIFVTLGADQIPAYADQLSNGLAAADHGDFQTALRILRPLAEQGNPSAQIELGDFYRLGVGGVQRSNNDAIKWYARSARQGNEEALNLLVDVYDKKKDYAKAIEWLKQGASRGYAGVQFRLAQRYETGLGVKQDYAESAIWFRKADENGDPIAASYLGVLYENGQGVKKDYGEAFRWYWKAAWAGDGRAAHHLGDLYALGNGIPQRWTEAYFWYCLGAMSDAQESHTIEHNKMTDDAAKHLSQDEISAIEKRVREWRPVRPAPSAPTQRGN